MKYLARLAFVLLFCAALSGCGKRDYKEGVEMLENGEYEQAIGQFEASVEKEKNIGDSYRGIGIAKWETGDYEGAASAFEEALENGSEKTGAIYNFIGACRMQLGDYAGAVQAYEQALTYEDTTDEMAQEIRFNIIAAYEKQEDWEHAKERLAEYVKEYPEDAQAAKEAEFLETR